MFKDVKSSSTNSCQQTSGQSDWLPDRKVTPTPSPKGTMGTSAVTILFFIPIFSLPWKTTTRARGRLRSCPARERKKGEVEERQGDWRLEIRTVLPPTGIDSDQTPTTIAHRMEAYNLR